MAAGHKSLATMSLTNSVIFLACAGGYILVMINKNIQIGFLVVATLYSTALFIFVFVITNQTILSYSFT